MYIIKKLIQTIFRHIQLDFYSWTFSIARNSERPGARLHSAGAWAMPRLLPDHQGAFSAAPTWASDMSDILQMWRGKVENNPK